MSATITHVCADDPLGRALRSARLGTGDLQGGGECAGRSPVDRGKRGLERSTVVEGYGIPLGRVLAGANQHDSPLLAPTLDTLADLGPLPEDIVVHLDAGYDSGKTREELAGRG